MNEEYILRIQCILKHCQHMERDGLANSLHHLRQIEEDARALEDLVIGDATEQPVHLGQHRGERRWQQRNSRKSRTTSLGASWQ